MVYFVQSGVRDVAGFAVFPSLYALQELLLSLSSMCLVCLCMYPSFALRLRYTMPVRALA